MIVALSARTVFAQRAVNDNVPARRRRLARFATVLAIAATSEALVLVHSAVAWFPAPARPFARVSELRGPAPVVLALATSGRAAP